jgi:hypothetical protein
VFELHWWFSSALGQTVVCNEAYYTISCYCASADDIPLFGLLLDLYLLRWVASMWISDWFTFNCGLTEFSFLGFSDLHRVIYKYTTKNQHSSTQIQISYSSTTTLKSEKWYAKEQFNHPMYWVHSIWKISGFHSGSLLMRILFLDNVKVGYITVVSEILYCLLLNGEKDGDGRDLRNVGYTPCFYTVSSHRKRIHVTFNTVAHVIHFPLAYFP